MKELNPNLNPTDELEARLRSWTPREPSPALERRLFRRAASPVPAVPSASGRELTESRTSGGHAAWLWRLVAPAAACGLAMLVLVNEHGPVVNRGRGNGAVQAGGGWGAPATGGALARMNLGRNVFGVFRGAAFEWTNRNASPSTSGSFSLRMTNSL